MRMTKSTASCLAAAPLILSGLWIGSAQAVEVRDVLASYADIALAGYQDSLTTARALDAAIDDLIANPSEGTLDAARAAWIAARAPYQQTEVFRFGNAIVDDWEGRVNAWPLDEGLFDYVDATYGTESDANPLYTVNVIANRTLIIDGEEVDASELTPAFLQDVLQEAGETVTPIGRIVPRRDDGVIYRGTIGL